MLEPRPMIKYVAKNLKGPLTGVELGVYLGSNAISMLKNLNIKRLYLVDPYVKYEQYRDPGGWVERTQKDFDEYYKKATSRLYSWPDKVVFLREYSDLAAVQIPDDLDFVYVDANHSYKYVKRDIETYYPKLKVGGVIGGDNFDPLYPGVAKAVLEFINKHHLKLHGGQWELSFDWWVIKGVTNG